MRFLGIFEILIAKKEGLEIRKLEIEDEIRKIIVSTLIDFIFQSCCRYRFRNDKATDTQYKTTHLGNLLNCRGISYHTLEKQDSINYGGEGAEPPR